MVSAYIASVELDAKTHNFVRIKFHQLFKKTGMLDGRHGEMNDLLFTTRQNADYSDFLILSKEEIFPLIEQTKVLLDLIKSFINI